MDSPRTAPAAAPSDAADDPNDSNDPARLRAQRDDLRDKLDQIAQVIGCQSPDKIVHDVRNVMNELGLLRKLAELED